MTENHNQMKYQDNILAAIGNTPLIKMNRVNSIFEVRECSKTGYKSMFAAQDLRPFMVLSKFGHRELLANPTRFTVQVNDHLHLLLVPAYLQYINHSCHPNVFFDIRVMVLLTLRPIQTGAEVAFFYPSTEWKMTEPFDCVCNNKNCLGRIRGAAYLTYDNLTNYRLSDHILHKYGRPAEIQYKGFARFKPLQFAF